MAFERTPGENGKKGPGFWTLLRLLSEFLFHLLVVLVAHSILEQISQIG
jgi:hypothetical protein